jgi:Peptidase family M28
MIKSFICYSFIFCSVKLFAQKAEAVLNAKEALRIESFLASDQLKGRKTGTPEIDKAADFIAAEFKKSGLNTFNGLQTYKQTFMYVRTKLISSKATFDTIKVDEGNIIAITTDSVLNINERSDYKKVFIGKDDNLFSKANDFINEDANQIIFVDPFFVYDFKRLKRYKRDALKSNFSKIFIIANNNAKKYTIEIKHAITETAYTNVLGVLPGKSKKDELVVFSGHYDHLGTAARSTVSGDSVYNGANDDAAGTTAVIMLANYFAKLKNNERTLIFVAFTAEEIGGFGSKYFSTNINANKVVAMFNLEMMGTESKWGKNSAYITGFEKSDFGKILQKNLVGTAFHFEPDPYPSQNLFYRSDNATLAALGVPAHTISTSKMDSEPNYHKLSDEVATLDMTNMTEVIKAIALSSKTIVSGKDTPSRVEVQK